MELQKQQYQTLLQSWQMCHQLMQGGGTFVPELRFIDQEGVTINAVDIADIDALKNRLEIIRNEKQVTFAVLNQSGMLTEGDNESACVISQIFVDGKYLDRKVLFAKDDYVWDELLFDKLGSFSEEEANRKLGYKFPSLLSDQVTVIRPAKQNHIDLHQLIYLANESGDWTEFESMMPSLDYTCDLNGEGTLLHKLVYLAPFYIVEKALALGADPNAVDCVYHRTPAFKCNRLAIHKLLIDHGLNINHQDINGITAIWESLSQVNGVVKLYVDNKLDLKLKDNNGRTLLFAYHYMNIEALKYLMYAGIDVNEQDEKGLTALFLMVEANKHEFIEQLINNGAALDIKTTHEYTLELDDNLILPAGSSVIDLVKLIDDWLISQGPNESDWITQQKEEFAITKRMLINCERFSDIEAQRIEHEALQREENKQEWADVEANREKEKQARINATKEINRIKVPHYVLRIVFKLSLLAGVAGLILVIVSFFVEMSALIGISVTLIALLLAVLSYKAICVVQNKYQRILKKYGFKVK